MLDGPIGGASFNNEFGRPNIGGYFRTLEVACASGTREVRRGYHKPIMLAGGLGNIRSDHVYKNTMPTGAKLVVLGGPAMLIGLGGGAASSVDSGQSTESLDFASVQRGNAEMQRRCQEVIDACIARGQATQLSQYMMLVQAGCLTPCRNSSTIQASAASVLSRKSRTMNLVCHLCRCGATKLRNVMYWRFRLII